jgi:hypothetical protein
MSRFHRAGSAARESGDTRYQACEPPQCGQRTAELTRAWKVMPQSQL